MKINRQLRKDINAAVRAHVRSAAPLAEVGYRDVTTDGRTQSNNALKWHEDADLNDMRRLADVRELDDDALNPGCFELDLYVTTGVGLYRELETNVCVLIRDGKVVGATSKGLRVESIKRALAFPLGGFDDSFWGERDTLKQRVDEMRSNPERAQTLRTTAQRRHELDDTTTSRLDDDGERWCRDCHDSYNVASGCECGRKDDDAQQQQ